MYADCLRNVLSHDGRHQVLLVEMPDTNLAGVIILDAGYLTSLPAPATEQKRLLVMARKEQDDLAKIWDAGVRHLFFYGDSPERVRVVVLGMELGFWAAGASAG